MAPLSIQIYVVGPVQTNCYFAINDDTKGIETCGNSSDTWTF